jgi:hypothetical protein
MIFNFNGSGGGNETIKYNADDDHNYYLVNGEWIKGEKVNLFWDGYLYNNGTINGNYAGDCNVNYKSGVNGSETKNANNIVLSQSSAGANINEMFENPIDVTKFNKLIIKGKIRVNNASTQAYAQLGISTNPIGSVHLNTCEKYRLSSAYANTSNVDFTHELDVSAVTGEKYVYYGLITGTSVGGAYGYLTVEEVYVE